VELCSPDWKNVIASTKTDENELFSIEQFPRAGLFYLRVSAVGMDFYQHRCWFLWRAVNRQYRSFELKCPYCRPHELLGLTGSQQPSCIGMGVVAIGEMQA
jgi:hypothetical protein